MQWHVRTVGNQSLRAGYLKLLKVFHAALVFSFTFALVASDAPNQTNAPTLKLPQRVVIPKFKASVKIDGELNEPVWSQAVVLHPFYSNDHSTPEHEGTELRLWYDRQAIYLGWKCYDADIVATFTNRDSKFWEEDVVEFFLTPNDLRRYFELQWSPLNGNFDAIITNDLSADGVSKGFHGDWSYTTKGMTSMVKVHRAKDNAPAKERFWQAEVRLPFSDLKHTPKPKDVWRGNFFRINRSKNDTAEMLSWSPTHLPGFHQPAKFGYLQFGE